MPRPVMCVLPTILLSASPFGGVCGTCRAQTEQDALDDMLDRIKREIGSYDVELSAAARRSEVLQEVAREKLSLELLLAREELAGALAVAGAEMVERPDNPAQARGKYVNDVSQAISRFQQAIGAAYNRYAQDCSQAFQENSRQSSAALQSVNQGVSEALQRFSPRITQPAEPQAPPVVDVTIPDIEPSIGDLQDAEQVLEEALAKARATYQAAVQEARQKYRAEVTRLLDQQPAGAEAGLRSSARRAVSAFEMAALDAFDEYVRTCRSALRRYALGVLE
ncbi:MAG: hypothetical protein ACE5O2_09405 [Armatimonadota bacterium]